MKIQMWVWKEEMVPVKLQFFDSGDILLKTLTMNSFQPVSGDLTPHERSWRTMSMEQEPY